MHHHDLEAEPALAPATAAVPPPAPETSQDTNDTLVAASQTFVTHAGGDACLVNIYPTGPAMGTRYKLGASALILGRDDPCDIHLDDPSVSRRHDEIRAGVSGHYVIDLQSTNGTFVNDRPAAVSKLRDGDYLRVGNRIFRYLAGGNVESQYHEEIYRLTVLDGLTGAHNQRSLLEFLERELARSARHRRALSLVLFDIDHFKAINDHLGHLAGDYTLRELAGCLREAVDREQLFARYGGEEFAVVMPETPLDAAVRTAERLRVLVEQHPFWFDGREFAVTISLGAFTTWGDAPLTPAELIRRADEKLYAAKNAGRNRVNF
jgi:diguanylate cyclase (GGDEF)-like protein